MLFDILGSKAINSPQGSWTPIDKNRFDAVVTIKTDSGIENCSGVLVDANHVLTAAACVEDSASKPLIIIRTRDISHNSHEHCDQAGYWRLAHFLLLQLPGVSVCKINLELLMQSLNG